MKCFFIHLPLPRFSFSRTTISAAQMELPTRHRSRSRYSIGAPSVRYHDSSEDRTENVARIRRVQGVTRPHHRGATLRNRQARSGVSTSVLAQSQSPRSKAEEETRWPRPVRLVTGRFCFSLLPDQLGVSNPSADDLGKQELKAVEIVRVFAIVEPEHLLVNVGLPV